MPSIVMSKQFKSRRARKSCRRYWKWHNRHEIAAKAIWNGASDIGNGTIAPGHVQNFARELDFENPLNHETLHVVASDPYLNQ